MISRPSVSALNWPFWSPSSPTGSDWSANVAVTAPLPVALGTQVPVPVQPRPSQPLKRLPMANGDAQLAALKAMQARRDEIAQLLRDRR